MKVLVTDDDIDILSTIADYLQLHGIEVDYAHNGKQAINLTAQNKYDVLVLDVMMPKCDGISACKQIREVGCTTPILFLTARDTLEDKIDGFNAGADDYLIKPFAMMELLCRIEALGKRISRQHVRLLKIGSLGMDLDQGTAKRDGRTLMLNSVQFRLLAFLMNKAPQIVTREQLEQELWQDSLPESDALRSHIYQLRAVLDKPFAYPMLKTVRGRGYRLVSSPSGDDNET